MFKILKNIDFSFRQLRRLTIYALTASLIISILSIYYANNAHNRVYILIGGAVMEAAVAEKKDYLPVIAKAHIKNFHQLFWTLEPDDKYIQSNISQALYLADESAKRLSLDYREAGYYSSLISGNVSQSISIDSIALDMDTYPFHFQCWATEKIVRPTSITTRALLTNGDLRTTGRSPNNELGFLIEKLLVLDNHDIKTKNR
ncbi:MAG: conjugative transposon protein TraK [Bacteroidetes bacterium]|nr:conjugative transposon protein TraK [Bacteroidota bacterium]